MKRTELLFGFLLIPVDIVMILAAFAAAFYLRGHLEITPLVAGFGLRSYLTYALYLLPIWVLLFAANGLYRLKSYSGPLLEFYRIIVASSTAILLLIVIIFLTKTLFFSRIILVFTWILSILFLIFGRILIRLVRKVFLHYGIGKHHVLVIGTDRVVSEVVKELERSDGFNFLGVVKAASDKNPSEFKVVGEMDSLPAIIKKSDVDEIILADSHISKQEILQLMQICEDQKVTFKYVPDVYSLITSNFTHGLIGTMPVMELKSMPLDGWGRIFKRVFDVLFSLLLLIVFSPLFILIALLVKISSKGPIFYLHQRVGREEKVFNFYKFRSMYLDKCDFKGGVYWTTESDEKTRVTPIGRILRKTNLDELPQFWNILRGDMSFVGPRPELPKLVDKFENEIPDYFRRHRVKVGLTGWAQVNGLKGDTSVEDRVKYDIYYIENWTWWFDLKIIIKTVGLVIYEAFVGKSEYRPRS